MNPIYDDKGELIKEGDVLLCKWGYAVRVFKLSDGHLSGQLICDQEHACANIPYHLNNGEDYIHLPPIKE